MSVGINHQTKSVGRLLTQFREAANLIAYIEAFTEQSNELEAMFQELLDDRWPDTAIGAQLDIVGDIVGVSRFVEDYGLTGYFGTLGSLGSGPFGTIASPGTGNIIKLLSQQTSTELDDETYRVYINAKILKNITNATIEDVITSIGVLVPGVGITITEDGDDVTGGLGDCATDWMPIHGVGWTHGTNQYDCDGTQTSNSTLTAENYMEIGQTYKTTFTVKDRTAGDVFIRIGDNRGIHRVADGTYTEFITCTLNDDIRMVAEVGFIGSVTDIIIEEPANAAFNVLLGDVDVVSEVGDCSTDWMPIHGAGWTHDSVNNEYDSDGISISQGIQTATEYLQIGTIYTATYTVKNVTTGGCVIRLGQGIGTLRVANGTYVEDIECSIDGFIRVSPSGFFGGSVTDFSITRSLNLEEKTAISKSGLIPKPVGVSVTYEDSGGVFS